MIFLDDKEIRSVGGLLTAAFRNRKEKLTNGLLSA